MLKPEHITGLCETSASFTYSLQKGIKPNVTPYFSLKVERDNADLVLELQEFFGAGRVYQVPAGDSIHLYFRITNKIQLLRIVSHFDIFPLAGRKRRSYAPWKNIVLEKQQPPSKQNRPALMAWARELTAFNRRNSRSTFKSDEGYRPYG